MKKMAFFYHPETWLVSVIMGVVGRSDGFFKPGSFQKLVGKNIQR